MRTIKFLTILFVFAFLTSGLYAQGKPAPIKSPTIDMLIGTWTSSPYEMMGSMWSGESAHSWKYNGQYMFIDINDKDDKGNTYSGVVVIVPSADGSFTGYGFDEWGGASTISGKTDGNKIHAETKSLWGASTRDIEINGNTMVHKISWTMKGQDGKDMSQNITINYTKK